MSVDFGSVDRFSSFEETDTEVSQAADVIEALPSESPSALGESDSNGGGSTVENASAEERDGSASASLDVWSFKSKSGELTLLANHELIRRAELQADLKSAIERELDRLEQGILAGRFGDASVVKNEDSAAEVRPSPLWSSMTKEAHLGSGPSHGSQGSLTVAKYSSAGNTTLMAAEPETQEKGTESTESAPTLTTLCSTPRVLEQIYNYLPPEKQTALSSTSRQLYHILRKLWLGKHRTWIKATLHDSAHVQTFSRFMDKVAQFEKLVLYLDCPLGPEFSVNPVVAVTKLECYFVKFSGSLRASLSKLSAAFPAVTDLSVSRHSRVPFAENVADLQVSWSLKKLCVDTVPVSLFSGCVSNLTALVYYLNHFGSEYDVMYRIPSAMLTACKDSMESIRVLSVMRLSSETEFEVCQMADVANLTKLRTSYFGDGIIIGNLNVSLMPLTVTFLHHRGRGRCLHRGQLLI